LYQSALIPGRTGSVLVLLWRIFAAVYFALTMVAVRIQDGPLDELFLRFFTHWTLILLGAYGVLGTIATLRHLACYRLAEPNVEAGHDARGCERDQELGDTASFDVT